MPGRQRDDQIAMNVAARPPRHHNQTAIRARAKAATARSISPASRMLIGFTSTLSDGATAWMTANWPVPEDIAWVPKDRRSRHARRDLLEQLQPFPADAVFERHETGGVAARPRQAVDEAGADRIGRSHEHHRHVACRRQNHSRGRSAAGQNEVGRERDQFRRIGACAVSVTVGKATKNLDIEAVGPPQSVQRLQERLDAGLSFRIVRGQA